MPAPLLVAAASAAAPIIKDLMANGLSLLAGAVANKGADYVEEKFGVKLDRIDPAKADELRQLEMDHEEELQRIALEGRKLDVETLRLEYADLDSARALGAKLAESQYWLNANIVPLLAITVVAGGCLMLWNAESSEVRMAAVSFVMMPLGYYFGSSLGSKDKQAIINKGLR